MKSHRCRLAGLTFLALLICGAGTEEALAQYSRRSPIVQVVQKTRASIVTIIVPKTRYQSRDTVGTGIVIDERGFIVTNHHVVGSKKTVTVHLAGGRKVSGRVILSERKYDLAILRVDTPKRCQALRLAPAGDLLVGETVVAIGHPYGYTNTVSVGIVSAVGRDITMPTGEVLRGLIQTDASINPGNSGGPLLNINGELIGVNAAIRDGAQGIAFAIPSNTVRDLLKERLSALKISRVGHGMEVKERVVAETGDRQRVVVDAVYQNTPAAQAGLRPGDQILKVHKLRVSNGFDLERALWGWQPGQKVEMTVRRRTKVMTVNLTLADGRSMNQTAKVDFSAPAETVARAESENRQQSYAETQAASASTRHTRAAR